MKGASLSADTGRTEMTASVAPASSCGFRQPPEPAGSSSFSRWGHREIAYPNQVVRGEGEGEESIHLRKTAMLHLANHADRLQPTEDFFDPLPLALAYL